MEPTRDELMDAVQHALARLQEAEDEYERVRGLLQLRWRQVAQDELRALRAEVQAFDRARDVTALYVSDRRPGRRRR